jgi:hypothetical protein
MLPALFVNSSSINEMIRSSLACSRKKIYVLFQELFFMLWGLGLYYKVTYFTYPCLFADITWS